MTHGGHTFSTKSELQAALVQWFDNSTGMVRVQAEALASWRSLATSDVLTFRRGALPCAQSLTHGHINSWDVSRITDMNHLFMEQAASQFNDDIGNWDVSRVTDMGGMLDEAFEFNQDVSRWDVSRVTVMSQVFQFARSFNQVATRSPNAGTSAEGDAAVAAHPQDLSACDVSSVVTFDEMFAAPGLDPQFQCNMNNAWSFNPAWGSRWRSSCNPGHSFSSKRELQAALANWFFHPGGVVRIYASLHLG
jgi:surface protein